MRAPDYWQSGPTAAIGHLLSPLGALYAIATSLRASAQPSWKAPVPVICLGNLVMGGAGKTLVGTHLARQLIKIGQNPHHYPRIWRRLSGLREWMQTHIHIMTWVTKRCYMLK